MNQLPGRHTNPALRTWRRPDRFSSLQKRPFRRLFRLHFQSALNEKEPERRISVKRSRAEILMNFRQFNIFLFNTSILAGSFELISKCQGYFV
jgi:hypothetical protein